ncbi:replication-relaxation family protein [Nocardioides sp. LHD-245]|uniref:replication-relaxation family protein n=1 Tax=Nocardioides sp. LHD-245 TaxID=3051387 RepID=UPI0027E06A27|nr:replication-relaxation family protein [Nocardioides sp. LHD-245]
MSGYTPGAGLPTGLPLGFSSDVASPQVSDVNTSRRGTTTRSVLPPEPAAGPLPRKRRRVDADVLNRIADNIPERDRQVLDRIGEHRYLTTHQVQAFVFTGHASDESAARTARYVLARLERLALIRSLARRIGGVRAGSAARVWQLAPAGARLLRDDGSTFRTHEPSERFLAHCLAVADAHLAARAVRLRPGVQDVTVQTEPDCWRRYTGQGGEPRWLQPDLALSIQTAEYTDRWFIEVDLGTESLPTLLRKCGHYEAFRRSGIEQHENGTFPLVLWLFAKPERADRLRATVLRSPRLTPALYRYTTPETFTAVLTEPLS